MTPFNNDHFTIYTIKPNIFNNRLLPKLQMYGALEVFYVLGVDLSDASFDIMIMPKNVEKVMWFGKHYKRDLVVLVFQDGEFGDF